MKLILLFFSLVATISCISKKQERVFKVALRSLPSTISPRANKINIYHYINLQLFYPMFYLTTNRNVNSHYFNMNETKSIDASFKHYQLCLKENVKFSDRSSITTSILKKNMEEIHQIKNDKLFNLVKMTSASRCITVELEKPDMNYLHKLTTIDTAILKIPETIGMGGYKLIHHSEKMIKLARVKRSTNFKEIHYKKENPESINLRDYDDFNYMWYHWGVPSKKLSKVKKYLRTFSKPLFRIMFILVNHPSKSKRNLFKKCFSRDKLLTKVNSTLESSESYIPRGMPGHKVNIKTHSDSNCLYIKNKSNIKFYNIHKNITKDLEKIFSQNNDKLPFNVIVEEKEIREMAPLLFDGEAKLGLFMAESLDGDVSGLLKYFYDRNSLIINRPIKQLKQLCHAAINTSDESKKKKYFERAHKILLESGYVIPLWQPRGELYYPRYIKNAHVADEMLGFPLIEGLKL